MGQWVNASLSHASTHPVLWCCASPHAKRRGLKPPTVPALQVRGEQPGGCCKYGLIGRPGSSAGFDRQVRERLRARFGLYTRRNPVSRQPTLPSRCMAGSAAASLYFRCFLLRQCKTVPRFHPRVLGQQSCMRRPAMIAGHSPDPQCCSPCQNQWLCLEQ